MHVYMHGMWLPCSTTAACPYQPGPTCSSPVWSRTSKNCTPPMSRLRSTQPQTVTLAPTSASVTAPQPCERLGQVNCDDIRPSGAGGSGTAAASVAGEAVGAAAAAAELRAVADRRPGAGPAHDGAAHGSLHEAGLVAKAWLQPCGAAACRLRPQAREPAAEQLACAGFRRGPPWAWRCGAVNSDMMWSRFCLCWRVLSHLARPWRSGMRTWRVPSAAAGTGTGSGSLPPLRKAAACCNLYCRTGSRNLPLPGAPSLQPGGGSAQEAHA